MKVNKFSKCQKALAIVPMASVLVLTACGGGGATANIAPPSASQLLPRPPDPAPANPTPPTNPPPANPTPPPANPAPSPIPVANPENANLPNGAGIADAIAKANDTAPSAGSFIKVDGKTELLFNDFKDENNRKSPTMLRIDSYLDDTDVLDNKVRTNPHSGGRARMSGIYKAYYDDKGKVIGLHAGNANMAVNVFGDYTAEAGKTNSRLKHYTTNDQSNVNPHVMRDAGLVKGGASGAVYSGSDDATLDYLWQDPAVAGWNYQTFGSFVQGEDNLTTAGGYQSIGIPTEAGNIPTTGSAEYKGFATGEYHQRSDKSSYKTVADSRVYANFGERKLNFSTTNTQKYILADKKLEDAKELNLLGSASWDEGSHRFTGTLNNTDKSLSGNFEGRFYGDKAQEVGGVFGIQNDDKKMTYIGGFGAKRD